MAGEMWGGGVGIMRKGRGLSGSAVSRHLPCRCIARVAQARHSKIMPNTDQKHEGTLLDKTKSDQRRFDFIK